MPPAMKKIGKPASKAAKKPAAAAASPGKREAGRVEGGGSGTGAGGSPVWRPIKGWVFQGPNVEQVMWWFADGAGAGGKKKRQSGKSKVKKDKGK